MKQRSSKTDLFSDEKDMPLNTYSLGGLGRQLPAEAALFGIPLQTVLVISASLLILLIGGGVLRGKSARAARNREAQERGIKLSGKITAVKRQTGFDRERTRVDVRVKLEYFDPRLGEARTVPYILDRHTKNLPPQISGPGAGITDLGAIGEKGREMMQYKRELESRGSSKSEVKDALMQRALEQSTKGAGETDAEGYLMLNTPVRVDVYLNDGVTNSENDIHVVFP